MRQARGWYSMTLRSFTQQEQARLGAEGWVRAWHGCKVEALYSILHHGRLFESRGEAAGERILQDAAGVYVHKDGTSLKAENYCRFVSLCNDGVFWAAKWEVRVAREQRVKIGHKDQWCQREAGVQLAALWVCGRTAGEMEDGVTVSLSWSPELEANPHVARKAIGATPVA